MTCAAKVATTRWTVPAGDDTLGAGTGSELLRGGDGIDIVDMTGGPATRVDLPAGSATGQGNDTLEGIENVSTGAGNDTLIGNADNNRFDAGTGDDQVDGGDGYDTLVFWSATAGISLDVGGAGVATGGAGNDSFVRIESFAGSAYGDTMTGTAGNDNLEGGGGNNSLSGLGGHDTLHAGKGNDTLRGGAGNDWLSAGKGSNLIDGGADIDDVSFASVSTGVQASLLTLRALHDSVTDTLAGIENLRGTGWADTLIGDAGSNVVDGGAGPDLLDGGNGIDTVAFGSLSAPVNLQLATGLAVSGGVTDTVAGFENAEGSGYNDTLGGDANDNRISGGKGNDSLLRRCAATTRLQPDGNEGNDTADGGAGTADLADLTLARASYAGVAPHRHRHRAHRSGRPGADAAQHRAGALHRRHGGHHARCGSTSPHRRTTPSPAASAADTLDGLAGNDSLSGLGGDDVLIGGAGIDTLVGGPGNDVFVVDLLTDVVVEAPGEGRDRVDVALTSPPASTRCRPMWTTPAWCRSVCWPWACWATSCPTGCWATPAPTACRALAGNDTLDGGLATTPWWVASATTCTC
jgi:Ca2+-binding RTX toxin-like protein